jgi:hypothetical protein
MVCEKPTCSFVGESLTASKVGDHLSVLILTLTGASRNAAKRITMDPQIHGGI